MEERLRQIEFRLKQLTDKRTMTVVETWEYLDLSDEQDKLTAALTEERQKRLGL